MSFPPPHSRFHASRSQRALLTLALALALPASAEEARWQALSYNVFYEQAVFSEVLSVLEAADADLMCLQEVTPAFSKQFARRLAHVYPHLRFEVRSGTWGIGIASKHRMQEVELFEQAPHRMPALRATLVRGRERLVAVCVHLFPPGAKRRADAGRVATFLENADLREQQAERLVKRFEAERRPVLLLGDFNEGDECAALRRIRNAGFERACAAPQSECGATYPAHASFWPALFQVDHVLGRGLHFRSAAVLAQGSSDHYPIVAGFELASGRAASTQR